MAQRTITIQIAGPADPTVTSIPCVVTGSTVAGQSPITVDAFVSTNSLQANDGDILTITGTQVNGSVNPPLVSPVSAALEFVAAAGLVLPGLPVPPPPTPLPPVIASITGV